MKGDGNLAKRKMWGQQLAAKQKAQAVELSSADIIGLTLVTPMQ